MTNVLIFVRKTRSAHMLPSTTVHINIFLMYVQHEERGHKYLS